VIGLLLAAALLPLEMWLLFGWGSEKHINPRLWTVSSILYWPVLPSLVLILGYHISWRIEARILRRILPNLVGRGEFTTAIVNAHRWCYGFFGLIVLAEGMMFI
jgi:hypothetical protein